VYLPSQRLLEVDSISQSTESMVHDCRTVTELHVAKKREKTKIKQEKNQNKKLKQKSETFNEGLIGVRSY